MRPYASSLAALALLLVPVGCTTAEDPEPQPAGPHIPDLPTGGCGMPDYDWLPTDEMGQILDWERVDEVSLPASSYDALLDLAELPHLGPVPYGTKVYRIRYLTQDRGEPYEATGLLAFPDVDEPTDFPTLGLMHPTMGFSDACAPSAASIEILLGLTLFASFGYAVAIPDYIGMNGMGEPSGRVHPYIVPEPTAVASLDAIRALYAFQDGGHVTSLHARGTKDVALWGVSQGGFAALWADRYASGYAPELDIRAVVASVPPTDLVGLAKAAIADYIDATEGFVAVAATSWDWYRGELHAPLSSIFTEPVAEDVLASLVSDCGGGWVTDGAEQVEDLFTPAVLDAVANEELDAIHPLGCYIEQGTLVTSPIPRGSEAPVLFQVSEYDELVVGHVERASASTLCEAGYVLDYIECQGADHVSGAVDTLPLHIQWLEDRLAGLPLEQTCVIHEPEDCSVYWE